MAISTEIQRLQGAKASLKTSIENKGVTVPAATKIDGYAALVDQISGGGGDAPSSYDAVRLFDYDGTLLYSYSAADFANLTAMPANPSHTGLTAQGWNWSLADAKTYVAAHGYLEIGQSYITTDGKTRAYFSFPQGTARLTLTIDIYQSVANGVTINWGDGSATETIASSNEQTATHTYPSAGDYVIEFDVAEGCTFSLGSYNCFIRETDTMFAMNMALKKVELGARCRDIGNYSATTSYNGISGLETISIPKGITDYAYRGGVNFCSALKAIVLPEGMTNDTSYSFSGTYSLRILSLPKSWTKMPNLNNSGVERLTLPENYYTAQQSTLSSAINLRVLILPSGFTNIADLFRGLTRLEVLKLPSTVTTIADRAFEQTQQLQQIDIPSGVTSIGNNFLSTAGIQVLTIPDRVSTIGNAFSSYRCLTKLVIGSGITSIGTAFTTVTSLKEVHIKATTPPTLSASAFSSMPSDCVIYVPSASLTSYQTASNWLAFADKIVAETA